MAEPSGRTVTLSICISARKAPSAFKLASLFNWLIASRREPFASMVKAVLVPSTLTASREIASSKVEPVPKP